MKTVFLVGVVIVVLCGAYWVGSQKVKQQSEEEDRIKIERNLRFDDLERAYWPSSVDLKDKSVLVFEYSNLQPCTDACNLIVNGISGAKIFYAFYKYPDAPDFDTRLDLSALVQGRIQKNDSNPWSPILKELAMDEPKPEIDYVIIQMSDAVAPIISKVLKEHDLAASWGEAVTTMASVPDSRSFKLNHKDIHYIKFHRLEILGNHHARDGSYSFNSGVDDKKAQEDLRKMLGA